MKGPRPSRLHSAEDFKKQAREPGGLVLALRKELAGVLLKSDDASAGLDFVLSTPAVDRAKDTIEQTGWKLDNYRKNPVVLWAHDSSALPVARAPNVAIELGQTQRLVARGVVFQDRDVSEMGWSVGQMYRQGFLNAVSVGFLPCEYKFNDERGDWACDFLVQELLEFSAVPVPANPEALIGAKSAGIPIEWVRDWASKVLDTPTERDGFKPPQVALIEQMFRLVAPKTFQVPGQKDGDNDEQQDAAALEQMASLEAALHAHKDALDAHACTLSANTAAICAHTAALQAAPAKSQTSAPITVSAPAGVTAQSIAAELERQLSQLTGRTS